MAYQRATLEECFDKWLESMRWKQSRLIAVGYTVDQAIEMLKVYELGSLEQIEVGICSLN